MNKDNITQSENAGPVRKRIKKLDALRGFALLGVCMANYKELTLYAFYDVGHTVNVEADRSDTIANFLLYFLVDGKFYTIFSVLFGIGFSIIIGNAMQRGANGMRIFYRRMLLLLGFGFAHLMLLWSGDILMLYAVYGLLLIPISYLPSKWVWCIIALLAIQPVELFCLLTGYEIDHTRFYEISGIINAAHEHGTFWENTLTNLRYGFEVNLRFNIFSGRLTQLLCLFILGMQLGRQRMFYNEGRNLKIWHRILFISAAIVVILSFLDLGILEGWFKPIYNLIILLMIVSAIVSAWYAFNGVRRVLHHLCVFGRMSLTNYLLQSVIGCFIFCGYGLACYHHLGITYAVMVGCGMVVCQYLFARYWFSSHPRGPLEGIWRKLTWM